MGNLESMTTAEGLAPAPATVSPVARIRDRSWRTDVVLLAGLLAAASNCTFLFRAMSPSRLDPFNSMISELEVPGQPFSEFFRWSSLLSGVAAAVFAAGLYRRIPRGGLGLAGCWALAGFGVAGAVDAVIPMDCAPSASAVCLSRRGGGSAPNPG
jgi:hypothetical protein